MRKYKYLLSVVIPTKNRQEYAEKVIEQILMIESDELQLIIQDNSETCKLKKIEEKYFYDKRLKYNYIGTTLSFVDNFNQAISLAEGEYICIIGDDDGIMPDIIKIVKTAKEENIDAIIQGISAVFFWPSKDNFINKKIQNGYLSLYYVNENVSICNSKDAVRKLMSNGGQNYLSTDMVKLYHGVVRRSCLDTVKRITGHYFGGLSPDIYAATALSLVADKVVKINYPITISGICSQSGSADSATGKHTGNLSDAPHFKGHSSYEWAQEVPKFYSVETIWADSSLQALKELKLEKYRELFDIAAIDALCLKKYPQFKKIIEMHLQENNLGKSIIYYENIRLYQIGFVKKCFRRIMKIMKKEYNCMNDYEIFDIEMARKRIEEQLNFLSLKIENIMNGLEKLRDTEITK